ncbi:Broad specificity phosphatase PhoE [Desulfatibacillum alkenivorans DSM 16219]|jgi:broad specificity phosphatase PhoE|uniref:Broad specificity phosphatase PhoE n=2 Tax=Desulfatibacillum alkenivorans TaxID=259354 RepID=A0A1M6QDE9_9BACT|nr:Broad specificity phosphatase PhoE [Desulfatibacillum alkenivorans DSM 16219]
MLDNCSNMRANQPEQPQGMILAMSLLYMVRHGQASFGTPNYDRLSPTGQEQSKNLARHLIDKQSKFHAVYTGNMLRHQQTAQPLVDEGGLKGLCPGDFTVNGAFDEYDATSVWTIQIEEMIREEPSIAQELSRLPDDREVFERLFRQAMLRWVSGDQDEEKGPTWKAFSSRVAKGVKEVMETHGEDENVIVFSSAGPVSAALQFALDLDYAKAMELAFSTLNASVTVFEFNRKHITLQGYNNVSYLEESLITDR